MDWLNKAEYPFQHRYFNVQRHALHYIDEGQGDTLLFVHGTPSWSFDFRNVIKKLSVSYRCIAIDHIGFGLSDKPANYDYRTVHHGETLAAFVKHLQLTDITLVMHDFGGPIGFYFAINHPNLIKKMVVLNSWLWSAKGDPSFKKLSKVLRSPLLPFLYLHLNFSPRFLLPSSFGNVKLSRPLRRQFTQPFSKKSERYGALAFARSLLNDQDWFESMWIQKAVLERKPVLFVWGMNDKFVTAEYLVKFQSGFRNAIVKRLDGCGHFPQEEQPDTVANEIELFMQGKNLVENNSTVAVHKNPAVKHEL